ncbi:MAG: DNA repair protein RecO [Bryobacteraceae bacterium]|nr:DNA repair protein RecO [Bryobacteraceae bacterium]MDW8378794.1 DNA repair protein RecO [Bryobacterales bacterium]
MASRVSESIILRTYPFAEADLIVSFFTRDQGKLRGVARRARRPKSSFGAGLERLSVVQMHYYQRENRELVTLDSCDLIRSQFALQSSYETAVGLDYIAELAEELLPPHEPNDRFFRLLIAVLDFLSLRRDSHSIWAAVLYTSLWAVRLSGFLPPLRVNPDSLAIAQEMFEKPIGQLSPRAWTRQTASDLRQFLHRTIEEQIEKRLLTVPLLESL